jgi:hypothetical protein
LNRELTLFVSTKVGIGLKIQALPHAVDAGSPVGLVDDKKGPSISAKSLISNYFLVGGAGFEPATPAV